MRLPPSGEKASRFRVCGHRGDEHRAELMHPRTNERFSDPAARGPGSDGGSVAMEDAPVLIVDSVRRCVEANEAASRLLGLTRAQLVGRDVDSLRLPEQHLLVLPRIEDASFEQREHRGGAVEDDGAGRRRPSKREREILGLLARGSTDTQIAEILGLSPATVQTHVRNAKAKLGARTRAQAVALALVGGLIELD